MGHVGYWEDCLHERAPVSGLGKDRRHQSKYSQSLVVPALHVLYFVLHFDCITIFSFRLRNKRRYKEG